MNLRSVRVYIRITHVVSGHGHVRYWWLLFGCLNFPSTFLVSGSPVPLDLILLGLLLQYPLVSSSCNLSLILLWSHPHVPLGLILMYLVVSSSCTSWSHPHIPLGLILMYPLVSSSCTPWSHPPVPWSHPPVSLDPPVTPWSHPHVPLGLIQIVYYCCLQTNKITTE